MAASARLCVALLTSLTAVMGPALGFSIYGSYSFDSNAQPYFNYTFNEMENPLAVWNQSESSINVTRRDHFHVIGNSRMNVVVHDVGVAEALIAQRSLTLLNKWDYRFRSLMSEEDLRPEDSGSNEYQLGGGYSYVTAKCEGCATTYRLSTASLLSPLNSTYERLWGNTWAVSAATIPLDEESQLHVLRNTSAPPGNTSYIFDDIEVRLDDSNHRVWSLLHTEYWGVNYMELQMELLRTGGFAPVGDALRQDFNEVFNMSVTPHMAGPVPYILVNFTALPPAPVSQSEPSNVNYYPFSIFLACLNCTVPTVPLCQKDQFFGPRHNPHAGAEVQCVSRASVLRKCPECACPPGAIAPLSACPSLYNQSAAEMPSMLAFGSPATLTSTSTVRFRYAFGYLGPNDALPNFQLSPVEEKISGKDLKVCVGSPCRELENTLTSQKPACSASSHDAALVGEGRHIPRDAQCVLYAEGRWRSRSLHSWTLYQEYFEAHAVPQGSAYLYLHGMCGAPRDLVITSIAVTWTAPHLARDMLRMVLRLADASTGRLYYTFDGFGYATGAVIHTAPSDLDIYLLWGITHYVRATGDVGFLGEEEPFYPKNSTTLPPGAKGYSVLDHMRAAFYHLRDEVGLGPHGVISLGDGDWSDGILYESLNGSDILDDPGDLLYTRLYGESIPNSAMAAVVLPRAANLIRTLDPVFAAEMSNFAATLRGPMLETISTRWFGRAWFKNAKNESYLYGNDGGMGDPPEKQFLSLESQIWPLMDAAFPLPSSTNIFPTGTLQTLLQEINTQLVLDSPIGPRSKNISLSGQVWPAISQQLTMAMATLYSEATYPPSLNPMSLLLSHSWHTHATAFPHSWIGVWSGPDGLISTLNTGGPSPPPLGAIPGGSWLSAATPMTDFPVANSNPDAQFLSASLATAGITTTGCDATPWVCSNVPRGTPTGCIQVFPRPSLFPMEVEAAFLTVSLNSSSVHATFTGERGSFVLLQFLAPEGLSIAGATASNSSGAIPTLLSSGIAGPLSQPFKTQGLCVPLEFSSDGDAAEISVAWK